MYSHYPVKRKANLRYLKWQLFIKIDFNTDTRIIIEIINQPRGALGQNLSQTQLTNSRTPSWEIWGGRQVRNAPWNMSESGLILVHHSPQLAQDGSFNWLIYFGSNSPSSFHYWWILRWFSHKRLYIENWANVYYNIFPPSYFCLMYIIFGNENSASIQQLTSKPFCANKTFLHDSCANVTALFGFSFLGCTLDSGLSAVYTRYMSVIHTCMLSVSLAEDIYSVIFYVRVVYVVAEELTADLFLI